MDKQQREMLSVKSAIERTLTALTITYNHSMPKIIEETEKYVAALFASGQINRDFTVTSRGATIDINFSVGPKGRESYTEVTYIDVDATVEQPKVNPRNNTITIPTTTVSWPFPTPIPQDTTQKAVGDATHQLSQILEDANTAYERAMKPIAN